MPPMTVKPDTTHEFVDEPSFCDWLARHHDTADEAWIKIHKVSSGLASITPRQAIDVPPEEDSNLRGHAQARRDDPPANEEQVVPGRYSCSSGTNGRSSHVFNRSHGVASGSLVRITSRSPSVLHHCSPLPPSPKRTR